MKRDEAAAAKSRYPPALQPRIKEKERERKRESNLTTPDGYTYVLRLAAHSLYMLPVISAIGLTVSCEIKKRLLYLFIVGFFESIWEPTCFIHP